MEISAANPRIIPSSSERWVDTQTPLTFVRKGVGEPLIYGEVVSSNGHVYFSILATRLDISGVVYRNYDS